MRFDRSLRWLLACSVAATLETGYAGPEECLTFHDNPSVAGCANRYAPGTPAGVQPTQRPAKPAAQPAQPTVQVAEQSLLFPVPTAAPRVVAPKTESPAVIAERDRSELVRKGAIGLAALGLVFGFARWRASAAKTCAYCGSRLAPGAAVCKRCFRNV